MSSAMMVPVSASQHYKDVLAQVSDERMGKALASPEAAMAYAAELAEGFQFLAETEAKVEGQKARHGAYVYRLYASTAHKGKITIDGEKIALGQVVGKALGRWLGQRDENGDKVIVPLASGSVTRYRYIATLTELGFSPEDPEWSDLVNYYVSTPLLTAILKRSDPKPTAAEVREAYAILKAPKVKVLPPAPASDDSAPADDSTPADGAEDQDSQGPEDSENGAEDSTPADSTPPAEDTTPPATRENGPIPSHEIDLPRGDAGKVQYAEAAIAGLRRENLTPELLKRLTVLAENIALLVS